MQTSLFASPSYLPVGDAKWRTEEFCIYTYTMQNRVSCHNLVAIVFMRHPKGVKGIVMHRVVANGMPAANDVAHYFGVLLRFLADDEKVCFYVQFIKEVE
jgi:hypothetical protein